MVADIRKAEISDAGEIRKLYLELQEFEMSLLDNELRAIQLNWEKEKTVEDIEIILSTDDKAIYVATANNEIIGFVTGGFQKGMVFNEGSLDLFVKKEHRGKGIGTRLMETITDWFAQKKCRAFLVNVYSSNTRAKEFYNKFGMRQVGEWYKKKI